MAMRRLRAKAAAADALAHAPEQVGCQLEALETGPHLGIWTLPLDAPCSLRTLQLMLLLALCALKCWRSKRRPAWFSCHRACMATGVQHPTATSTSMLRQSSLSLLAPVQGYSALLLSETEPVPSTSELFQSIGISVEKSKMQAQSPNMSKQGLRQHLARANSRRPGHRQSRPDSAIASDAAQSTLPTPRKQPVAAVQQHDVEGFIKAVSRSTPISS